MNQVDTWELKSQHGMELEEEFYSFDLDVDGEDLSGFQFQDPPAELVAALRQKEEEVVLAAQLGKALLLENRQLREHSDKLHEHYSDRLEAAEVERALTTELQTLKQDLWQKGQSRSQDEELLSAMREQVARLSQKEQALEQRLEAMCQENASLTESLASLHRQLALQDQCVQRQGQQLVEAQRETEMAQERTQQLQAQVEELQEQMSLRELSLGEASLLSELERSLGSPGWGQDKEQVTQELQSILKMLLPLTENGRTQEADPTGQGFGLQDTLLQLRSVADELVHCTRPQELNPAIVAPKSDPCENPDLVKELQDQNAHLKEENAQLKMQGALAQQAIRDRDEAITKKNAMEAELFRSKNDLMLLNNQLLEAIQRKLELSQELEAWQDDIQVILNQQLKRQQQSEQTDRKTISNRLAFLRRPSMPALRPRRPSSSLSCTSEPGPERTQAPWRDWLKHGKIG
ncbi:BICD family-like cargo adapter 1 isoform X2 [Scleropages formosus]|uniref:Si:ch211-235m3.5 n=1 Tax=Scleropages formosus TaxID=113540 RepID=A0A8C9R0N7_SCLFO|nr:BICD family-like cargo adapter 1 isoform X2 [Scleropages formosus]